MHSERKQYDDAVADFGEAIRLDPKLATAYIARGFAWSQKKDFDKAIADYTEAIGLEPRNADAYYDRGLAFGKKKQFKKAILDYSETVRIDPSRSWAYNNRAWIWATCPDATIRDGKLAVESATRACELTEWKDALHLGTVAAACAEAGDFESAMKWQTKANSLYANADNREKGQARLKLYEDKKPYRVAD